MDFDFPKITVITGHYGCGKTNAAVNIALRLAKTQRVTVVDLDIVNPYFRTADFGSLFEKKGVRLVTPMYANSNLDIPALSFDLSGIVNGEGSVVIDVGGDPEGAVALGRYGDLLRDRDDLALYCVINKYRYLTSTADEAAELLAEIKAASGLPCSGIINNSNLGRLTDSKTVKDSVEYAEQVAKKTSCPLIFTCSEEKNLEGISPAMPIEIYVKPLWEQT
ncbi:MAG: hypothetical protein NC394_02525 [Bacteroides sp.]|nr:hypothetical protein [Bacteroides sp.]